MHERLRHMDTQPFGLRQDGDQSLARAISGDPEVTKLIGGPSTAKQVTERLAKEVGNGRSHRRHTGRVGSSTGPRGSRR